MDYKLLKQLKKAGFPSSKIQRDLCDVLPNTIWYYPTLSELIDAVVKDLPQNDFHLETIHGEWGAGSCCFNNDTKDKWSEFDDWYEGKTPEIAVSKLWLKLNK